MISLLVLLLLAGGTLPFLLHAAKLRIPAKTEWNYFEECSLMLLFPAGGEMFASFFLTRKPLVLVVGIVMVLLSAIGAVNRFRSRQKENPDDNPENDKRNLHALCHLAFGMTLLWAGILLNQYQCDWLPAFRLPK